MLKGKYLIKILRDKGYAGEKLEEATGLRRSAISQVELEKSKGVKVDVYISVAKFLGISIDKLIEIAQKMQNKEEKYSSKDNN